MSEEVYTGDSYQPDEEAPTPPERRFAPGTGPFLALGGVALVLIALGLAQWLASGPSPQAAAAPRPPRIGSAAPDFELKDLQTGQPVKLSNLRGKPVWVNVWATWCPACRVEMPEMKKLYAQYRPQDLQIIGMDVQEGPDSVKKYIAEGGYDWTFVIDQDGSVVNRYFVSAIPTHFFIGRDGIIKAIHIGAVGEGNVGKYLDSIVAR